MRLWRLSLSKTQFPPTLDPRSKHTAGSPASSKAFKTVRPDDPAPITAVGRDIWRERWGWGPTDKREEHRARTLPQKGVRKAGDGMLTLHAPGAARRRLRQHARICPLGPDVCRG